MRPQNTINRWRRAAAMAGSTTSSMVSVLAMIVLRIGRDVAQRPELLVNVLECPLEADLDRIARPRQIHPDVGLDPAGPPRQHDDAVAERDRFLEIVRDEHDRLALVFPEREQLALQL